MKIKRIFALLIIISGLGISFILTKGESKKIGEAFSFLTRSEKDPSLSYKNSASIYSSFSEKKSEPNNKNSENMTETLINNYFHEFAFLNQSGPQDVDGKATIKPISEEDFQKLMEEELAQKIDFEIYEEKHVKISNDNSIEAQKKYLSYLGEITTKNFANFKSKKSIIELVEEVVQKQKTEDMEKYIAAMENLKNDLLSLQTPSSWKEFHLQSLNLWQKKINNYTAVLNYKNDPLKAALALQQIEELIEETENIQIVLNGRIKELNL